MPFQPGHKLSPGRKKGVKNKSVVPLQEKVKELGIDPFEILLLFAAGEWKKLNYKNEISIKYNGKGEVIGEDYIIDPSVRARAASEACQYIYPKLKAIEHSGTMKNEDEVKLTLTEIRLPKNGSESLDDY